MEADPVTAITTECFRICHRNFLSNFASSVATVAYFRHSDAIRVSVFHSLDRAIYHRLHLAPEPHRNRTRTILIPDIANIVMMRPESLRNCSETAPKLL